MSFHRIVFRRRQKAALVTVADRLLIVGLALLIPAISSSVLLILDVVLGRWQAILGSSLTALVGCSPGTPCRLPSASPATARRRTTIAHAGRAPGA